MLMQIHIKKFQQEDQMINWDTNIKVVEIFKRKNNYNNLKINGIAIHIGSQITKIDHLKMHLKKLKN